MKKLSFKAALAAFFIVTAAHSQVVTTSEIHDFNGNDVTGDTMYYWVPVNGSHQIEFTQYNIGNSDVTYKVAKTQLSMVAGASAWFCIYHNADPNDPQSQCYIPSTTLSGDFITDTASFNMLLADFSAGSNTGTSIVKYKFYDKFNTADSAFIVLVYNVTPVGIQETVGNNFMGNVYPNPSTGNSFVNFSVDGSADAQLSVTDVAGRVIYTQQLNALTGVAELPSAEWGSGVYFVTMTANGTAVQTQKLITE